MKPSNCANIKMESGGPRRVRPTLYLAASAGGLLLALLLAVTLAEHSAQAAPVASKSDRPLEAAAAAAAQAPSSVATSGGGPSSAGGRPSPSSSSSSPASDDQLALPSSTTATTSKRLVPISHRESVSSASTRTSTKSSDLSVGQSNIAHAKVHSNPQDMQTAAGHHYGGGKGHGKYYMYAESPKKGAYKAGFSRGNHKHMIERKEWQHKSHAGGHMKWHDKKGKGSHKWEFKHHDKKGKHHYG